MTTTTRIPMADDKIRELKDRADALTGAIEADFDLPHNAPSAHGLAYWLGTAVGVSRLASQAVAEVERLRAREEHIRKLHAERVITEYDHGYPQRETGRTWSICEACTDANLIAHLDDGELIEDGEGQHWPCPTIAVLDGEQTSVEVTV